jgi:opacity protein-like surface antigen
VTIHRFLIMAAFALALVALAPTPARADGFVVPFVGANFGAEVGRPIGVALKDRNIVTFGVGMGVMGGGVFGVELDLGYTTQFSPQPAAVDGTNNLLTVMPALILGIPVGGQTGGGVRPYAVAGLGLVRRNVDFGSLDSLSESDLAYTLGGGLMVFFADHVGVRGDVRYIRNFQIDEIGLSGVSVDRGTFDLGRASLGVLFRF